jgi:hypothetical protein
LILCSKVANNWKPFSKSVLGNIFVQKERAKFVASDRRKFRRKMGRKCELLCAMTSNINDQIRMTRFRPAFLS